jgi:hypothetical protein
VTTWILDSNLPQNPWRRIGTPFTQHMGGALNLKYCSWYHFSWAWWDEKAHSTTIKMAPGHLPLTSGSDLENSVPIQCISATKSFHTLGVHISPSGS